MKALQLLFLPISFQCVELLLFSKFPKETKLFYETLGYSFQNITPLSDQVSIIKHPPLLRLLPADQSNIGFRVASNLKRENTPDPDKRVLEFEETSNKINSHSTCFSNHWVTLLRTHDLEGTKKFYDFFGDWQKEQHENGPIHYCNKRIGTLIEIYPMRKKYSSNIEFIISVDYFTKKITELKKSNFNLIKKRDSAVLFKDPDDRLVQIWGKSI